MDFCTVKIFFKQRDATLIYTGLKLCKVFFGTPGIYSIMNLTRINVAQDIGYILILFYGSICYHFQCHFYYCILRSGRNLTLLHALVIAPRAISDIVLPSSFNFDFGFPQINLMKMNIFCSGYFSGFDHFYLQISRYVIWKSGQKTLLTLVATFSVQKRTVQPFKF